MNVLSRRHLLAGAAGSLLATRAAAQALPDTARLLVGFPPGGAPDIVARRLADQLVGKLARAVVVENRPGAAGRIAVDAARQMPADGLTLLLNPAGVHTLNPHTYRKLGYDPLKDFAPLSLAATVDFGLAVGPLVPAAVKNLADLTAWARSQAGGALQFGSPAAGSSPHFVGDVFARHQNLRPEHVPYRGGAPLLNDLMGGALAAGVLTLGDLVPQDKTGKLRLLAATGPTRSRHAPQVATFDEQAVPGLAMRDWLGVFIAGTPAPDVLARVGPLIRSATASESYRQALTVNLLDAASSSAEELERLMRTDLERWGAIVRRSGFVADV